MASTEQILSCIFLLSEFPYVIKMNRFIRMYPNIFLCAVLFIVLIVSGCGGETKEIPKEERGEPNVLPEEIILYREARDTFRDWTKVFNSPRSFDAPFNVLSRTSKNRLHKEGVKDTDTFERWFTERANAGLAPFSYLFSRFDILDIEMRDTLEALLTGTFIVQTHGSSFESVGTFRLHRQGGRWVVPFMESGDYETSWWQKERQFSARVREEGSTVFSAQKLGISVRYPITWDAGTRSNPGIPGYTTVAGSSVELTYIDPSTLLPQAVMRIIPLPDVVPDSLYSTTENTEELRPVVLHRANATITEGNTLSGKLTILADIVNNRQIAILTVVDENSSYQFFGQTFESILSSIAISKVNP